MLSQSEVNADENVKVNLGAKFQENDFSITQQHFQQFYLDEWVVCLPSEIP